MRTIIVSFLFVFMFSCTASVDIVGFNEEAWTHDKNGCEGIRYSMKDELAAVKEQLKALSTDEIISVLGRPDKTKLGERNQRHFLYSIAAGNSCESYSSNQTDYLSIRFNATGYSYEILIL